jgi:RNA polymerase sigma-70 factor (ECF subfamily)
VTLERARAGDETAFQELTDPYRRELQLHCYRMLGSIHDAEDLLQETLLAAWRGLKGFEGRASLRSWLYKIATNRCLNAIRDRPGRKLSDEPWPEETPKPTTYGGEPLWLEPYPDALIEGVPDRAPGPEARYELREGVALAFVAGLQRLPARQRTVLVLRDVLGYRARETAEMLESTEASVNSALQRARATLDEHEGGRGGISREAAPLPDSVDEREIVERFVEAHTSGNVRAMVDLLADDAVLTMPPEPRMYIGREDIYAFMSRVPAGGDLTLMKVVHAPLRANGQPAIAFYIPDEDGVLRATVISVLTLSGSEITAMTAFGSSDGANPLFEKFGLPLAIDA